MKIVSACLVGIDCAFDGKSRINKKILELFKKGELIPVCPEQLGGLSTPRDDAEILNGDGYDVLDGRASVMEKNGKDVTENFIRGAYETLKIAKLVGAKEAVMKARSPSCGCNKIYDGSFSKRLRDGVGVTVALLKRNNIKLISDEEFSELI